MPATRTRQLLSAALVLGLAGGLAACGSGSASSPEPGASAATGPITIWYSNNPEEVAWGKAMVKGWNADHPDQTVTGQEIPAGKTSEEVIFASITAGTAPCLIYNTAPSAVPQFQRAGGLVALDTFPDGVSYIQDRSGTQVEQFKSADGMYYQFPWKLNPVMIFYNKEIFRDAGIDADNPPLATYDDFLATSQEIVDSGAAKAAIYPAPSSEFFQSWFDFYPLFAAAAQQQLVVDGKATFNSPEGVAVGEFWRTMYERGLTPKEKYNGDSFADGVAAMSIVGPWAVKVYGDKVDWGVAPVPTADGKPAEEIMTFSDAKNVGLYTACENDGTAWEFLKYTTSLTGDEEWLNTTGQMPYRADLVTTYPDYFDKNPAYTTFADQANRVIEVPNVDNSTEIWQAFRNMWTKAVVFGEGDLQPAFDQAAEEVNQIVATG
ncbi:MAG: extracellular solute-binding protein [Candidatus Nanopelagicales bacterium]